MIQISKCYKCKKTVHDTPIGELEDFYFVMGICLYTKCLEEIVEDYLEGE